jgi:hypothetical protein
MGEDPFALLFPVEPDEITTDGNTNPVIKKRIDALKPKKNTDTAPKKVTLGTVGKAMAAQAAQASGSGSASSQSGAVAAPPSKRRRRTGPK